MEFPDEKILIESTSNSLWKIESRKKPESSHH